MFLLLIFSLKYISIFKVVAAGETDDGKLIDMILQTKQQINDQGMRELIHMFQLTAEYSQHIQRNEKCIAKGRKIDEVEVEEEEEEEFDFHLFD